MANLKDFVWEKTKEGLEFDVYVSRVIRIGSYKVPKLSEKQLVVDGEADFPIIGKVKGSVEILIQNSEKCTVKLTGGEKQETLPDRSYHVAGNEITIDIKKKLFDAVYIDQIKLSDKDRMWTWLAFSVIPNVFVWVGGWPKGYAIAETDFVKG